MSAIPLKDLLRRHGLQADKRLGQHFLLDANVTDKIVRLCGNLKGLHVVEVGPGPGGLTGSILRAEPASLTAIEKDERCLGLLQECYGASPLFRIIAGDALKVSLPQEVAAPRAVIANLPYNVGTEMLIRWLYDIAANANAYQYLTLMFQKEVVDRLAARPSTKDYGRLSVLTQWLCEAAPLFDLPPGAFSPPPKVTSTVVKLTPLASPLACDIKKLEKVTAAAFGQRRKMLRSSLKSLGGEALLEKAEIEPTLRAENLTVEQFIRLANLTV